MFYEEGNVINGARERAMGSLKLEPRDCWANFMKICPLGWHSVLRMVSNSRVPKMEVIHPPGSKNVFIKFHVNLPITFRLFLWWPDEGAAQTKEATEGQTNPRPANVTAYDFTAIWSVALSRHLSPSDGQTDQLTNWHCHPHAGMLVEQKKSPAVSLYHSEATAWGADSKQTSALFTALLQHLRH